MKRIVTWVLGTITTVTLLFGYHTSTSGPTTATVAAAPLAPESSGSSGSGTTGSGTTGSGTTGSGTTVVTGSVASTRWGPVQVRITVAAGQVTAVDVVQEPDGNRRDQEINAEAVPILTQEALTAQSAKIDMVSGATVTSEGYLQSLQSALDQAGL